jgi:predicted nucleic acid-binding protein
MIKRFASLFFATLLVFGLVAHSVAQNKNTDKADDMLNRVRELDILNQILPVLLTKDQVSKILPAVERSRKAVAAAEKAEFEEMKKLDEKIQKALKDAYDTGKVPSRELLGEAAKLYRDLTLKRLIVVGQNADAVYKALDETLNAGQKKAAANALEPSLIDSSLDKSKMTEEEKLKFWVRIILLDPVAYDILVKIGRGQIGKT